MGRLFLSTYTSLLPITCSLQTTVTTGHPVIQTLRQQKTPSWKTTGTTFIRSRQTAHHSTNRRTTTIIIPTMYHQGNIQPTKLYNYCNRWVGLRILIEVQYWTMILCHVNAVLVGWFMYSHSRRCEVC